MKWSVLQTSLLNVSATKPVSKCKAAWVIFQSCASSSFWRIIQFCFEKNRKMASPSKKIEATKLVFRNENGYSFQLEKKYNWAAVSQTPGFSPFLPVFSVRILFRLRKAVSFTFLKTVKTVYSCFHWRSTIKWTTWIHSETNCGKEASKHPAIETSFLFLPSAYSANGR